MSCTRFEDRLDDFLEGSLAAPERREAEAHLKSCADCRDLVAALAAGFDDAGPAPAPAGLTDSILEQTSGSPCRRAHDLLGDLVDGLLTGVDADLVRMHLDGCAGCSELAVAMQHLHEDLPAMALLSPGPDFVDDVLTATQPWGRRLARRLAGLSQGLTALLQRPRFSWEAAYVGAVIAVLLFGTPVSPFKAVPGQALAMVQLNPVATLLGPSGPLAGVRPKVSAFGRTAWAYTGGALIDSLHGLKEHIFERYEQAAPERAELRRHGTDLKEAIKNSDVRGGVAAAQLMGGDVGHILKRFFSSPEEDEDEGDSDADSDRTNNPARTRAESGVPNESAALSSVPGNGTQIPALRNPMQQTTIAPPTSAPEETASGEPE